MPYCIYRTSKLKTLAALRLTAAHTDRSRTTKNADLSLRQKNEQLIGFGGKIPSPMEFVAEWERLSAPFKRKPDAVLAQELFLGTSPEFFDSCDFSERFRRLVEWKFRTVQWLRANFGENCFSATLHLDEKTPHIVAYVLPVAPSAGKDGARWLSAYRLFNPYSLRKQQDTYAAAVADLGLERGIRHSTAKHEEVRAFYGAISQPPPADGVDHAARQHPLVVPPRSIFQSDASYRRAVEIAVERHVGAIRKAAKLAEKVANVSELRRRQLTQAQETNKALACRLGIAVEEVKEKVSQLRDIPLSEVLARFGLGTGRRSDAETVNFDSGDHSISVKSDSAWNDSKTGKQGRKSIDLVRHLLACSYVDAVAWLSGLWSTAAAAAAISASAPDQVLTVPKRTRRDLWDHFAKPDVSATTQIAKFLSDHHCIASSMVDRSIASGLMHGSVERRRDAAPRIWCVFNHVHSDEKIKGASLVAAEQGTPITRVLGDWDNSFFRVGPPPASAESIAIVDHPISALSFAQLRPAVHVLSMAGNKIPQTIVHLVASTTLKFVVGLPSSKETEDAWIQFLRCLREGGLAPSALLSRVTREIPVTRFFHAGTNWNDVLRASLEFGRSQPSRETLKSESIHYSANPPPKRLVAPSIL